jgi:membrane protein DedA with SNARE-associated domain
MGREGLDFSLRTVKPPYFRIETLLFSVALVTLFISLGEIADCFELPFESLAGHLLVSGSLVPAGLVTSSMASFGYAAVFVLMVLESASLPIPSEVVLPFAGYLGFKGSMNFAFLALISTAAGLIVSTVDYYLAFRLGRPIVEKFFRWSSARPEHLDGAEQWLSAKGSWTILAARFVPRLRSAISLPAGAIAMEFRTFIVK